MDHGFTKKPARRFWALLQGTGVQRVVDIRLHNVSQLAGFAKQDDLAYFLETHGIGYVHRPDLAPTPALFDAYKKHGGSWETYAAGFLALMAHRQIATILPRDVMGPFFSVAKRLRITVTVD